jgi:ribosomal-protein-serine acetyltransferase
MIIKVRENLELRVRRVEEAAESFAVIDKNREYLREYLPWVDGTQSVEDIRKTIEGWQKKFEEKSNIVLGIYFDNKYVGNMGLHDIRAYNNNSAEIGYWLAEDEQGKGIMTDCVRDLTDYGFNVLDLNRIYIECAVSNKKSRAIPERLGFVHKGTYQDGTCLYGVYQDAVIYGIVKRNWVKKFKKI